jgi:uracil-DNA glycosylase
MPRRAAPSTGQRRRGPHRRVVGEHPKPGEQEVWVTLVRNKLAAPVADTLFDFGPQETVRSGIELMTPERHDHAVPFFRAQLYLPKAVAQHAVVAGKIAPDYPAQGQAVRFPAGAHSSQGRRAVARLAPLWRYLDRTLRCQLPPLPHPSPRVNTPTTANCKRARLCTNVYKDHWLAISWLLFGL